MPIDPNNPNNPNNPGDLTIAQKLMAGIPVDTPPSGVPPRVDPNVQGQINNLNNVVHDVAATLEKIVMLFDQMGSENMNNIVKTLAKVSDDLGRLSTPIKRATDDMDKWEAQTKYAVGTLKAAVGTADEFKEAAVEISRITKSFRKGLFGDTPQTYKQISDKLKSIVSLFEEFKRVSDPKTAKKLELTLKGLIGELHAVEKAAATVGESMNFPTEGIERIARVTRKAAKEMDIFSGAVEETRGGFLGLAKAAGMGGVFERFAKYGQVAKNLREFSAHHKAKYRGKGGGPRISPPPPEYSPEEWGRISPKLQDIVLRAKGYKTVGGGGKGGAADIGSAISTVAKAGGEGAGIDSLFASIGEVSAMVAEFADVFAGPLGIIAAIIGFRDSTVKANQEMFKKQGVSGIFTGGVSSAGTLSAHEIFANRKMNMAGLATSSLGVNREQNEAIEKAFQDLGFSVDQLSQNLEIDNRFGGTGLITDKRARGYAGVQELSYTTGKKLGMDAGSSASETLKLLYKFGQSQTTIKKLSETLTGDIKDSGITITKYLSIIDDISSSFGSWNTSLQSVTSTMRLLGSTGTQTSDQLKESMDTIYGGPKRDLSQSMAILSLEGQKGIEEDQKMYEAALAAEGKAATEALEKAGIKGTDVSNVRGIETALTRLSEVNDTQQRQALSTQLRTLETAAQLNEAYKTGNIKQIGGIKAGGAQTQLSQAIDNFRGLEESLKRIPTEPGQGPIQLSEYLLHGRGAAEMSQMAPGLVQNKNFGALNVALGGIAQTAVQALGKGVVEGPDLKKYEEIAEKAGKPAGESLKNFIAKPEGAEAMKEAILNNEDMMRELLSGKGGVPEALAKMHQDLARLLPSNEDIARQTTTWQGRVETALEKLVILLGDIVGYIEDYFLGSKGPEAKRARQLSDANSMRMAVGEDWRDKLSPEQVRLLDIQDAKANKSSGKSLTPEQQKAFEDYQNNEGRQEKISKLERYGQLLSWGGPTLGPLAVGAKAAWDYLGKASEGTTNKSSPGDLFGSGTTTGEGGRVSSDLLSSGASKEDIKASIARKALAAGVPPIIALGVAKQESDFNPFAMGSKGDTGLFQLMPKTAKGLGVDPKDINQNITGGVEYLRQLYDQFHDWSLAIAAYNAGPGNVYRQLRQTGGLSNTGYLDGVIGKMNHLAASGGLPGGVASGVKASSLTGTAPSATSAPVQGNTNLTITNNSAQITQQTPPNIPSPRKSGETSQSGYSDWSGVVIPGRAL